MSASKITVLPFEGGDKSNREQRFRLSLDMREKAQKGSNIAFGLSEKWRAWRSTYMPVAGGEFA